MNREAPCVADEALFLHWPRARAIIDSQRELMMEERRLEADAAAWARSGKNPAYLVTGLRLERATKLYREFGGLLTPSPPVREFIERSRHEESLQQQTEFIARARRARLSLSIAALIVLSAGLAGSYSLDRSRQAERQRQQAQASLMLALDATNSLVSLAQLAREVPAVQTAPLVANALVIVRELARTNPDNRQAQDNFVAADGALRSGEMR
jgi:hypothetical protein